MLLRIHANGTLNPYAQRVRERAYDPNKLYASEIMAILLQTSQSNQKLMASIDGIDMLLQAMAPYKKREPKTEEEIEVVENLFNAMSACLLLPRNQTLFLQAEGIELMIIMLKSKHYAGRCALRVLDHALNRQPEACERFVEMLGLKTLFPCLVKRGVLKKSKKKDDDLSENVISMIASMLSLLKADKYARVINKFKERDLEKVDVLVEMHVLFSQRVAFVDQKMDELTKDLEDEEKDDFVFSRRMDAGLYTLHMVDVVLAHLLVSSDEQFYERITLLLNQYDGTIADVKDRLEEYRKALEDESSEQNGIGLKARLLKLIEAL